MADDPIGRWLILLIVVVGFLFALRPDWIIRVLSFGKSDVRDVKSSVLFAIRIISIISAAYGAIYLVWNMIRQR